MKKHTIYVTLLLLLSLSSCRVMSLPETRTPSDPYVQLKNGEKFTGTSATRSTGVFVKDKVILGDTSFNSKDVAFYSTGGVTYANVGRKLFAQQVADGKINMYKYTKISTSSNGRGGGTSTHVQNYYFIQKGDSKDVKPMSYKNLKPMVQINTPEYKMLEQYRKTRVISRILGYGSLGLIGVGAAVVSGSTGAGAALVAGGIVSAFGWYGTKGVNNNKLLKTVIIADKTDAKSSGHTRVK
ncbi:MAG: hypothetical protein WCG87_12250 [Bacteroidota bacterium]